MIMGFSLCGRASSRKQNCSSIVLYSDSVLPIGFQKQPRKIKNNLNFGAIFGGVSAVSGFILLLFLTACDPVTIAVGGTAIAGVELAGNQEGIGGAWDDSSIQASINKYLIEHDKDIFDRVELSVKHGTVVVVGYMRNQQQCERVKELISNVRSYKAVYYELSIGNIPCASEVAVDSGITSRIKSALLFEGNVQSLNYDITTVKGVVYITGTAQTKFERDIVINCAKSTSGVTRVASYIRINKERFGARKRRNKN